MLLQKLRDYAEQQELPPRLYDERPIRYVIDLDLAGKPTVPEPMDTADLTDRRTKFGRRRLAPNILRSSGTRPLLLADSAEYTFGLNVDPNKPGRAEERHTAYVQLLEKCVASVGLPEVDAVLTFLQRDATTRLSLPEHFDPKAAVTFRVGDQFVIDLPAVQAFWAAENDPASEGSDARVLQCLVCGEHKPILERLQGNVKGIPGGQTSGTAIISANTAAFESYGLKASHIAPTCASCSELFTKGLNHLLSNESTSIREGPVVYVFWTRAKTEVSLQLLSVRKPEVIRELIRSVRTASWNPDEDSLSYYAVCLSASGGRAVVREWIDTTVGDLRQHLAKWFRLQEIIGRNGEPYQPIGLTALTGSLVRDLKDRSPITTRAMVHSALTGSPLPLALLRQAVERTRAEQRLTHPRAALIKMMLADRYGELEDALIDLDPHNQSTAYQCGRLLAVLEELQDAAIPGIKTGVAERFLGTASHSPATVFPRLLGVSKAHLAKIERDKKGAYFAIQRRLDDVVGNIPAFPRMLTLEDQGRFFLGYYHQGASDRQQAREAAERRRQGKANQADLEVAALNELTMDREDN